VQIIDPQSIEGGLPFRVFECGACAVPLLSDFRPELTALFPAGSGLSTATSEKSLRETAAGLFQMSKRDLDAQGQVLHQAFLAQHTWEHRWQQLMQGREFRTDAVSPTPVPSPTPFPDPKLVPATT
jgi:spore maturation protein CgeB